MEEARRLCMWGEEEEEHQESEEQAHVHMPLITTHKYEYQAYERRDYLRLESKNSRVSTVNNSYHYCKYVSF